MDQPCFDDFGNYTGKQNINENIESDLDVIERQANENIESLSGEHTRIKDIRVNIPYIENKSDSNFMDAVVLDDAQNHYGKAQQLYGENVDVVFHDEDNMPLEVPVIPRVAEKKSVGYAYENPETKYSSEFLTCLIKNPVLNRNVTLVGHLHHGKTTFMEMLLQNTHISQRFDLKSEDNQFTFLDNRDDEICRGISIKMKPLTFLLESTTNKSYAVTMIDTPGHVNFNDEVICAMRLCDGVLVCVDVAEGVLLNTERTIKQALAENLPICLLISKIDKLITQLKIPPMDAYHKIRYTIDEVNNVIINYKPKSAQEAYINPIKGNVCFSAAYYGLSFTLNSYALLFSLTRGLDVNPKLLSSKLWGEQYFHSETKCFKNKPPLGGGQRSFVQFVLEPLYKIFTLIIGEQEKGLERVIKEFDLRLNRATSKLDVLPLLKEVCSHIFGSTSGLVDMIVDQLPSSKDGVRAKMYNTYTGPTEVNDAENIISYDSKGPLIANVLKLIPSKENSSLGCLTRILSGKLKPGDKVKILGENFTPYNDEDSFSRIVSSIEILQSRYCIPLTLAVSGNIVLIHGIDSTVTKSATIVSESIDNEFYVFKPLQIQNMSVMKIATEPLNPGDLPKMIDGLRKINKTYPSSITKVEESGEHTIFGSGELYLDCLMKDLRDIYGTIDVKVADPVVTFRETVMDISSLRCFAETPNMHNKITMISEPLDKALADDIETGQILISQPKKKVGDYLQKHYNWDLLAGRRIWAFGPETQGPNLLIDDTLPSEVDQSFLNHVKSFVIQGFQWAAKEGPLCDEPIRNVKFKLLDAQLSFEPVQRNGAQIIPTARRCCYSAFLLSNPRLMEPVYYVEIITPPDCITAIQNVMSKRRGHLTSENPKGGTPVLIVKALIPVMESFGFETDLRYHTLGQAFCLSVFDHWSIVPGDPLDKRIVLRPLEICSFPELAREFMVKTRRRKGLPENE
jgi:U5 small nuclear ribonucleoprotein component